MKVIFALIFSSAMLLSCTGMKSPLDSRQWPLTLSEIQQAIVNAGQLEPKQAHHRYLDLAEQLTRIGELQAAISLFGQINTDLLDAPQFVHYTILASELYLQNQAIFDAYDLLTSKRLLSIWTEIEPEPKRALHQLKASVFSQLGDAPASIAELIALDALLVETLDLTENHDRLWQQLSSLPIDILTNMAETQTDEITQGWYQLAAISKLHESNLDLLLREVNNWTDQHPNHPASIEVPLDLQLLTTLIEQRPNNVALLLPLTGRLAAAGQAIRDGFFVAYFNQSKESKPTINLYDTNRKTIDQLYDQAASDGADLIIGPLEKDKVATLQQRGYLPVPILALNYTTPQVTQEQSNAELAETELNSDESALPATDNPSTFNTSSPNALYQFGLSLEDEAIQAADRAWLEGHRYAMVIASSADWSSRAADTFVKRWQEQGGKVVIDRRFDQGSNYSNTIKSAFAIDLSQQRARKLQRIFGEKLEFEPRRRQDIDMIFLVARSSEGQQIKPTLAFHYAGKIPVYATSQIYSSTGDKGENRDLNGIRFTTLPWTLEQENIEKKLIKQYINMPPNYERLYAMGIDAYRLHDRLKQLARSEATSVYGKTGKLHLNKELRIIREQPWAEIVKGKAQARIYLTKKDDETL